MLTNIIVVIYILRNCCIATLPMLYRAHEPAANTGVNTINNLMSILSNPSKQLITTLYYTYKKP